MRNSVLTGLSMIALLVTLLANAGQVPPPFGIRAYDIGLAPNFKLENNDGEAFELNSARGRWVFLHFWASWCGPCREEMPTIRHLSQNIKPDNLLIVMVNTAEEEDTIFSFLGGLGMDPVSLMDKDGLVTEAWKPRGLPTTFLIDPEGQVRYQAIGGRDWRKPEYIDFLNLLINSSKDK